MLSKKEKKSVCSFLQPEEEKEKDEHLFCISKIYYACNIEMFLLSTVLCIPCAVSVGTYMILNLQLA